MKNSLLAILAGCCLGQTAFCGEAIIHPKSELIANKGKIDNLPSPIILHTLTGKSDLVPRVPQSIYIPSTPRLSSIIGTYASAAHSPQPVMVGGPAKITAHNSAGTLNGTGFHSHAN